MEDKKSLKIVDKLRRVIRISKSYELDKKLKGGRNGIGGRLEIFCTQGGSTYSKFIRIEMKRPEVLGTIAMGP